MSTPLSIECSRLIYELVEDYETEKIWIREGEEGSLWRLGFTWEDHDNRMVSQYISWKVFPAPTFSELLRVLPMIKIQGDWWKDIKNMVEIYITSVSEPEGMKAAEEYLMKLLK